MSCMEEGIEFWRAKKWTHCAYNHATSNLAIYSHETSHDKLPEALNRQSIIVFQVHDKLHEKWFIFYMLISLN